MPSPLTPLYCDGPDVVALASSIPVAKEWSPCSSNTQFKKRNREERKNGEKCELLTAAGDKGLLHRRRKINLFSGCRPPVPFRMDLEARTLWLRLASWLALIYTQCSAEFTGHTIQCRPVRVHPPQPGAIL